MEKDYKKWTPLKRELHNEVGRLFFHEREVWYCHLGENIGFEQDGQGELFLRPVVIVRKFNNEVFWGIPLTRTEKKLPFYFSFMLQTESGPAGKSTAVLSQIRLIDAKRLRRLIGRISKEDFVSLTKKIKALMP